MWREMVCGLHYANWYSFWQTSFTDCWGGLLLWRAEVWGSADCRCSSSWVVRALVPHTTSEALFLCEVPSPNNLRWWRSASSPSTRFCLVPRCIQVSKFQHLYPLKSAYKAVKNYIGQGNTLYTHGFFQVILTFHMLSTLLTEHDIHITSYSKSTDNQS